jgi:hypothetical protein
VDQTSGRGGRLRRRCGHVLARRGLPVGQQCRLGAVTDGWFAGAVTDGWFAGAVTDGWFAGAVTDGW